MEGLKNFLEFINNNWTLIITLCGLILGIYTKIKNYINLSREKKLTSHLNKLEKVC